MRLCVRLHILLVLLATAAWTQIQLRPEIRKVTADPSGSCTAGEPIRHNTTSGEIFACNNGTWAKVATPGAGLDARWQTVGVGTLAARPATCTANQDIYICNGTGCGVNGEYYYCTSTDVWTLGSSSGVDTGGSGSGVISGCGVTYVSGLTFTVGACSYSIAGVTYNSPLTNVTLTAADPTNPRIDVIGVNNASAVFSLAGTPAANPSQPTVDTSTQLQLTFVSVLAAATTPNNFSLELIYNENTEWACSPSANINCASTSNPYSSATDIEATTAVLTNNVTLTKPAAGTVDLGTFTYFQFYIRSKATWPTGNGGGNAARFISISWLNGATQRGQQVVLRDGAFGFSSSLTSVYQLVSIPTSLFGANGIAVTTVRFQVSGNSGSSSIGFFLDLISLQAGAVFSTPTSTDVTPYWHTVGAGPSANRPVTCTANVDVYICNGTGCGTNGNYHYCTSLNTWTISGSSVSLASGATNDLPCYTSSTAVGPCLTGTVQFTTNILKLNAATRNIIHFGLNGVQGPATGGAGQKIQLRGTAGTVDINDYAIGVEANNIWYNSGSNTGGHKFYIGTNLRGSILEEASDGVFLNTAAGKFRWTGRGDMKATADGVFQFSDASGSNFGRLMFGGSTSSFPALKRSGAILRPRLGDDSADGTLVGGLGAATASATTTTLPAGNVFHITGTTDITTLNTCDATNQGRTVVLIFDGVLTFTDGNNLKLAGNFVTTADDTMTLSCDGTNWYEQARSVN